MAQRDYQRLDYRILKLTFTGEKSEREDIFHNFHELFYVSEGVCYVFLGERIYRAVSGDLIIIPAGTIHKTDYTSPGINTKLVVSFSKQTAAALDQFLGENIIADCLRAGRVHTPLQRKDYLELHLNRMLYEYDEQPEHAHSAFRLLLAELLLSVLRYRAHETENSGEIDAADARMQAVAAYLHEHYAETLRLEELAARFALSPSYLSRAFKSATGFGLKEFITHVRIQKATELLLSTDDTITKIAERCGFSDSNYFGDAFKKAVGVSPRQYRRLG